MSYPPVRNMTYTARDIGLFLMTNGCNTCNMEASKTKFFRSNQKKKVSKSHCMLKNMFSIVKKT